MKLKSAACSYCNDIKAVCVCVVCLHLCIYMLCISKLICLSNDVIQKKTIYISSSSLYICLRDRSIDQSISTLSIYEYSQKIKQKPKVLISIYLYIQYGSFESESMTDEGKKLKSSKSNPPVS